MNYASLKSMNICTQVICLQNTKKIVPNNLAQLLHLYIVVAIGDELAYSSVRPPVEEQ